MPISESRYRLGEFMITEHGSVLLTWAAHIAVGDQLSGECFVVGDILVIGPCEREESGYLKLEFHEHLMRLPAWNKTRYYCFLSDIREVGSGQSIAGDLIRRLAAGNVDAKAGDIAGQGTFRLGQYEIAADENGTISWKTVGQSNTTSGGRCFIESGVLFLGAKEYESDGEQNRQKFSAGLKLLPQWDRTLAWGDYRHRMSCKEPERLKEHAAFWRPEHVRDVKTFITNNTLFSKGQHFRKEKISEIKSSGMEWFKKAWHSVVASEIWGSLKSLIVRGGLLILRALIFVLAAIAELTIRAIERLREYYKDKNA